MLLTNISLVRRTTTCRMATPFIGNYACILPTTITPWPRRMGKSASPYERD